MAMDTNYIDYSQMIEQSTTGIVVISNETIIYANPYIYQLLEYNQDEKLEWYSILHPKYHDICRNRLDMIFKEQESVSVMEQRLISKSGKIIYVEIHAAPYILNKEIYAQMHIHDITDKKISEQQKKKTELEYKLISENITDILTVITADGIIDYVSSSITTSLGYMPTEMIGTNAFDLVHPDDNDKLIELLEEAIETKKSKRSTYRIKCKNGNFVWLESKGKVFYHDGKVKIIIDSREITEQIEAEKLLRQSEKMAVIGELSAGVVHEIKNPLTTIKGFLQLMNAGTINAKDYITILNSEIERIEQLSNDLLNFAKPSEKMSKTDLVSVLKDVIVFMEITARKKNIELLFHYAKEPVYINGDNSQLKQVFINLIKNAIEASYENSKIEIFVRRKKDVVQAIVTDYGLGIPKDKLDKIGESFFTTKEKGTGLGLMITQRIINNHKGTVSINSKEGEVTSFTLSFPPFMESG